MSADYYFFAPTGGRYQTVFRWTLPRRYSIRRSQWDNALTVKHDYCNKLAYPSASCVHNVAITWWRTIAYSYLLQKHFLCANVGNFI